jgi:hypothetical protein
MPSVSVLGTKRRRDEGTKRRRDEELSQRRSGGTQRCTEKRKPTPHLPLKQEVFITANSVNLCVFSVNLCVSSSLFFFAVCGAGQEISFQKLVIPSAAAQHLPWEGRILVQSCKLVRFLKDLFNIYINN